MIFPIAVYGNGEMYREVFNAIASVLNNKNYGHLIHLAILLSGIFTIVHFSASRSVMVMVRWLGLYYLAFHILFLPASIEIIDEVNHEQGYAVDHVPLGLAIMANVTTSIGAGLTAMMEQAFSLPGDLQYQHTGMLMASRLVSASTQFEITDPRFAQSMQSFVHQCVFYDLFLHRYSLQDLQTTANLWDFLKSHASQARAFFYAPLQGGAGQIVTCRDGVSLLDHDWKSAQDDAITLYAAKLFPQASAPKLKLLSDLPLAYQFLTKVSLDATSIIQQNMLLNALQHGVWQMGATTNASAALEAYAFTKAQQQKRLTNQTVGEMAAYWLPLMKNILEMVLYAAFVFVFLLVLFPFGKIILKHYVLSLLWLQLWAPLYAVLNLCLLFYAKASLTNQPLTLLTQASFSQTNADLSGLAGYLSLSVPLLAAGILKGMMSVFSQAAQYIAGITQGAASAAAGEISAGNASLGNLQYSNHSAGNVSANHFDTSARVSGGMFSEQMPGGSTFSITPDSHTVMNNQGAISNLGTSVNLAQSLRASYLQQADKAESAALSHAQAYAQSSASAVRTVYEMGQHRSEGMSGGDSWSYSQSTGVNEAISQVHRLTDRFAHNHHLSFGDAASVLGAAYANGSAGVNIKNTPLGMTGLSAGASAGYRRDATNTDSVRHEQAYSDAQDFVRDSGFAQNMDVVARASEDHSLRANNDQGARLVHNLSASFDQAQTARHEMVSSLQASASYRQMATLAEENAVNINANASQAVFETLSQQGITPRELENLMANNPTQAQVLVDGAVSQYAQKIRSGWAHDLPNTKEAVVAIAAENNATLPNPQAIDAAYEQGRESVIDKAKPLHLTQRHFIDEKLKAETDATLARAEKAIPKAGVALDKKGAVFTHHIKDEESRKRHNSALEDMFTGVDVKDD